jgi:LysM repeat protein
MAVQPQVSAGGSRQRLLLLLLAGVVAIGVVVLLAGPMLGRRAAEPAPVAGPAPATTVPPQLIGPSTTLGAGGPGTVAAAKDPFRPLVTPGAAAAPGDPAAIATPATGPSVQSTVPGAGQGSATTPGGGAAAAEQKVTLLDIVSQSGATAAKVAVDGTRYTVAEGETFAGDYRAIDIGSSCATFESDTSPFTLCEGEAVLK